MLEPTFVSRLDVSLVIIRPQTAILLNYIIAFDFQNLVIKKQNFLAMTLIG